MKKLNKKMTPESLAEQLGKSIKGQEKYLKDLALVLWLHQLRKEQYRAGEESGFPKVNMMVLGKSGTGKTSSIKAMAELLDMPVIIEDASQFTASGWKGRSVSEIACRINDAAKDDADRRFAVVVLDEIDKLYSIGNHSEANSPVNNLLKLIEGMRLEHRENANVTAVETENILFICLGAFEGIEEIIKKRINPEKRSIGFTGEPEKKKTGDTDILHQVTKEDLIAYGISPQLIGRMGLITATNELKAEDLEEIILDSDISAVRQFNKLFSESLGVGISVSPAAARNIADAACKEKTGARALSEKLFAAYKDGLYSIAGKDSVNRILLDAEDGELTIKYIEGKRNGKGFGKERDLYEKVPLDLPERSVRGAVRRAETIIGDVGDICRAYTYNQLRAVSYLYSHIIEELLRKGRKDPMMDDVADVLFDLMEDSITENLRGRSVSLDRAMRYEQDLRDTLWAGRDILQKYCRQYLARQEELEKVELEKEEI